MITATVIVPHVYAGTPVAAPTISPNPALVGQPVTFSGSTSPQCSSCVAGDTIDILYHSDTSLAHDCSAGFLPEVLGSTSLQAGLTYSFTTTLSTPGYYCAYVWDVTADIAGASGSFLIQAAPIPEYPLGLPILAILTIFAYGVIRRRTITKQK